MRILLIHPEGNVNNNPNLLAILEFYHQQGCSVDVLSKRVGYVYQHECEYFKFHLVYNLTCLIRHRKSGFYSRYFLNKLYLKIGNSYDLIVGVDREGLLIGDSICRLSGTPLGLISYEILFAEEIGAEKKQEEKDASRTLSFAICQDPVRAEKLSIENGIPAEKIICLPVSGRDSSQPYVRSNWLRERYGISQDKKIALYMGSIDAWSGFDVIIDDLDQWPEEWVLVVHGRYNLKGQYKNLSHLPEGVRQKVFISAQPFERFDELAVLPQSADLGIALYYPSWKGPLVGNNLKYLGWSSGKICTYLQCGLPVLVNEIGLIEEAVRKENFGYIKTSEKKISALLCEIQSQDLVKKGRNARNYYLNHLDFDKHSHKLIKVLESLSSEAVGLGETEWAISKKKMNLFYFWSFGPAYDLVRFTKNRWRKFLDTLQ